MTSRAHGGITLAFILLMPAFAAAADPSAATLVVRRCVIAYERDTPISSSVLGVLEECRVRPGDRIRAGQVLGRLQDNDVRAEMRLREAEANSDIEVRLMTARHAMAAAKAQRTTQLMARNAASREEFTQHKLEAEAAALDIEYAQQKRRVAGIQLDHARAVLKTRELSSPHDGVVVAVLRRPGEAVVPRDPIFQVVDPDHLRVLARVDVAEVGRLRVSQIVRVIPEIPGVELPVERESFSGQITFIDSRIDPETLTCVVHVLAENRNGVLRAGLEARVEIDPEPLPTAGVGMHERSPTRPGMSVR